MDNDWQIDYELLQQEMAREDAWQLEQWRREVLDQFEARQLDKPPKVGYP